MVEADVFRALADPTRRAVFERLSRGEMNVTELKAGFNVSQPAISQHLSALKGAGLVSERREDSTQPRADVVCRYGGEEFLMLAPETRLEGALALAEKIRRAAAERLFGDGERVFPLTLSVGVAELRDTESGNDMIARADDALYQAKQQGRNRVKAADN